MIKIPDIVIKLLKDHGFVIVSTLDKDGAIHCSAKGVVEVKNKGEVYLIDLYKRITYTNLKRDPTISLTVIDEDRFIGFTLKGEAKIVKKEKISNELVRKWKKKIIERISKRVIRNIKKDRGSAKHPESMFPSPEYLIEVDVKKIIDLTPTHLKAPILGS